MPYVRRSEFTDQYSLYARCVSAKVRSRAARCAISAWASALVTDARGSSHSLATSTSQGENQRYNITKKGAMLARSAVSSSLQKGCEENNCMNLVRWDPIHEMDQFFGRPLSRLIVGRWPRSITETDDGESGWTPTLDVSETESEY